MRNLARYWPLPLGVAGGLLLGLELSQHGELLSPLPWLIYGLCLVLIVGVLSWWSRTRGP